MKKHLLNRFLLVFLFVLTLSNVAFSAVGVNTSVGQQNYQTLEGTVNIVPVETTYELGSTSTRWAKIWATDIDVSGVFTFGGTMAGNLDMNSFDIVNADNITGAGGVTLNVLGTEYIFDNNTWISGVDNAGTGNVNTFKTNTSDEIEIGAAMNVGTFNITEDSGAVAWVDFPVSATPAAGTEESVLFSIDSNSLLKLYCEADGLGGVQNCRVGIHEDFKTYGAVFNSITAITAATYDLLATDRFLAVDYTTTGAVTSLTLPTAQCNGAEDDGRNIIIKDTGGSATASNITIDTEGTETIDGQTTQTISTDYNSVSLECYSSNWYVY